MRRTSRHNGADSDDSDVWNEILRRWTPTKATEDDSPVPIDGLKADEDRANKMAGETLEQDAQVARAQKNREVVRFVSSQCLLQDTVAWNISMNLVEFPPKRHRLLT